MRAAIARLTCMCVDSPYEKYSLLSPFSDWAKCASLEVTPSHPPVHPVNVAGATVLSDTEWVAVDHKQRCLCVHLFLVCTPLRSFASRVKSSTCKSLNNAAVGVVFGSGVPGGWKYAMPRAGQDRAVVVWSHSRVARW